MDVPKGTSNTSYIFILNCFFFSPSETVNNQHHNHDGIGIKPIQGRCMEGSDR